MPCPEKRSNNVPANFNAFFLCNVNVYARFNSGRSHKMPDARTKCCPRKSSLSFYPCFPTQNGPCSISMRVSNPEARTKRSPRNQGRVCLWSISTFLCCFHMCALVNVLRCAFICLLPCAPICVYPHVWCHLGKFLRLHVLSYGRCHLCAPLCSHTCVPMCSHVVESSRVDPAY